MRYAESVEIRMGKGRLFLNELTYEVISQEIDLCLWDRKRKLLSQRDDCEKSGDRQYA